MSAQICPHKPLDGLSYKIEYHVEALESVWGETEEPL